MKTPRTAAAPASPAARSGRLALAAALGLGLTMLPATAHAEDTPDAGPACDVTAGELAWGVKESFRSYISGAIANGEWTTADGATYETPLFHWSEPSGEFDASTGEGSVSFEGTVSFSGHGGVLQLTLANPTIEFHADGSAQLLIDAQSTDTTGEPSVDEKQVPVGQLGDLGPVDAASGSIVLDDVPVTLLASGVEAFADFYPEGDQLDPVSLTVELADCDPAQAEVEEPVTPEPEPEETVAPEPEEESSIPWLPIGIGAAALIVIAIAGGVLFATRKKGEDSASAPDAQE